MTDPEYKPRTSIFVKAQRFLSAEDQSPQERLSSADEMLAKQAASSAFTVRFFLMLALAGFIASLGLMGDSTVTIVGAMLIAPLMRPIVSVAYGLVILDGRIVFRSFITIVMGIIATIMVALFAEILFGLQQPTREMLSRTQSYPA